MKKQNFMLQLFADGEPEAAPAAAPAAAEQENPTNDKAPETAAKQQPKAEAKYTDDDVNKLIDKKFAEWQKKQQKAVDEAEKLATMNATQKAEYERDKLQKELDDYKKKAALAEMTKTARKMLSDNGINAPDDILTMLVSTEAETTKAAIDAYSKAFTAAVESAVEERLKGKTPTVGAGKAATPISEVEKRIKKYE